MSYPERGATYKNRPAWLDRAVAGEKHLSGGAVDSGDVVIPKTAVPMPVVEPKFDTGDRMEGVPSETNKPTIIRGKKPL